MTATRHELILGGARSGKSRAAESRALAWLAGAPGREAMLIATAWAGDVEMAARIDRHRIDRARRVPDLATCELCTRPEPLALAACIDEHSAPHRLLVVDCLTLWLTQCALPPPALAAAAAALDPQALDTELAHTVARASGPLVLVSNEIGLGVMPMAAQARACVDALGRLHQLLGAVCDRVTLMVAGLPLTVKPAPEDS